MKVSVITNRGVGIVRSAANRHEKCEIVGAVSSTHFENTANELATKAGEWWDGATGTITMVRASNGSLKVSVSFPSTSYAQPLKSVGILVKAQGDERAHVLYAVSESRFFFRHCEVILKAARICLKVLQFPKQKLNGKNTQFFILILMWAILPRKKISELLLA